jgi:hypothetical protein
VDTLSWSRCCSCASGVAGRLVKCPSYSKIGVRVKQRSRGKKSSKRNTPYSVYSFANSAAIAPDRNRSKAGLQNFGRSPLLVPQNRLLDSSFFAQTNTTGANNTRPLPVLWFIWYTATDGIYLYASLPAKLVRGAYYTERG